MATHRRSTLEETFGLEKLELNNNNSMMPRTFIEDDMNEVVYASKDFRNHPGFLFLIFHHDLSSIRYASVFYSKLTSKFYRTFVNPHINTLDTQNSYVVNILI